MVLVEQVVAVFFVDFKVANMDLYQGQLGLLWLTLKVALVVFLM